MSNSSNNNKRSRKQGSRSIVEPLEPRLLYSADVLNVMGGALLSHDDQEGTEPDIRAEFVLPSSSNDSTIEIVFIDSHVPEHQIIVDDISNNSQGNVLVYVIDSNTNGVEQIERHLAQHKSVSAIHLIAHEQSDGIRLGNLNLNSENTALFANNLSNWGNSLTESADILIYGCNLANSPNGLEFVHELATITGADVAASIDNTGNAALKANWVLEHQIGSVEAQAPVSDSLKDNWQHILAAVEVTTTTDKYNLFYNYDSVAALIVSANASTTDGEISLREAIVAANQNADLDIITLPAGVYDLTLTGAEENVGRTGDLDIEENLTIEGAGLNDTIINNNVNGTAAANDVARVIHIIDSEVEINNVSIQGGQSDASLPGGAGILALNSSLELNHVEVTNNLASGANGGGILGSASTIVINDSNIHHNSSSSQGGGIHVDENSSVELNNTIVSNNTALEDGGGAHIEGSLTINSSSLLSNASINGSGGGVYASTQISSITFNDARIESNTANTASGGGAFIQGAASINKTNFSDNQALNGGGIFYDYQSQTLEISNSTFFNNSALENGGAIQVDDVDLNILNTTIAHNTAGKLGAAIDTVGDHGKSNTIENTIVAFNVSTNSDNIANGDRQLDHEVSSSGFNLISGNKDDINFALGDFNAAHGSTNVTVNLASELTSINGSHSRHLALNSGSDAIDSGSGQAQADANGLVSNEFVDIGATEYVSTQEATKIFWIDSSQQAVYRGNQDGSGVQKILDFPTSAGLITFIDLDYDPVTQHIFYGIEEDYLGYTYSIGVSDSDGRNMSTSAIGFPLVGFQTGYTINAISVEQDKLYVEGYVLYAFINEYYIYSFDIASLADGSIDTSFFSMFDATHHELIPQDSLDSLTTLDVSSTFGATPSQAVSSFLAWGGSGTSPIYDFNFSYLDGTTAPANFNVNSPAQPSNETVGIALDSNNHVFYGAKDYGLFSLAFDNSNANNLSWDGSSEQSTITPVKLTDIAYDSANNQVWFSSEAGFIGYMPPDLTTTYTIFDTDVTLPSAISLTTLSVVNHLPVTLTGKPAFTISEGAELEITQTHLETTDTESDIANITYTVETNPTQGGLYHTSDLTTEISTFTQADLNNNRIVYRHSGDEPAPDSFDYTVSDGVHTLAAQTFTIAISQVNDAPVANTPSISESLTEQTNFTYVIPDEAFTDAEGETLTYQVTLANGNALPTWLAFDDNKTLSGLPDDVAANANLADNTLHIIATDPSGAVSAPMSLQLNITNINNTPSSITSTPLTIDENTTGPVAIGSFDTVDLDQADSHEYSVNDARFEFNNNVLGLAAGNSLNHETEETIELNVTSTDNGTGLLSHTQTFTVSVNDLNDNPIAQQSTISVDTNELDAFITTVSDTLFTDEDELDTGLSISAFLDDGSSTGTAIPASLWVQFDPATNTLSGTPQDSDTGETKILLFATDASGAQSTPVVMSITVNGVNQAPSLSSFTANTITENTPGVFVASVAATDPDSGDTLSYAVDDARFVVDDNNLSLGQTSELDYEQEQTVDVKITVSDASGASDSNTYTLLVINANDAPVANVTDSTVNTTELTEFVHSISATAFSDADDGDVITINAYLDDGSATGIAIPASHWLQWNPVTRELSGQAQDSDTGDTKLILIASDSHGAQSTPIKLTVSVADINQAPSAPVLTHNAITENSAGAFVGTVTASDADAADQLSFSVNDPRFQISLNAASQHELSLKPGISLNYEQAQSVDVQISADDGNGEVSTSNYSLSIIDANDTPTVNAQLTTQNTHEAANFLFDIPIGAFDDEDGDSLTLSIMQADGAALPDWLSFDDTNNRLSGTPDDSDTGTLLLHVFARDTENEYSVASPLTINVFNINRAPTDITLSDNLLNENSTLSNIGNLVVSDADAGDTHTYTVDDPRFRVENGVLQYASNTHINYETEPNSPTITIEVTATDSSSASYSEHVDIQLQNLDDLPIGPASLAQQDAIESQSFYYQIPDNTFSDEDGDVITYNATLSNGDPLPAWLQFNNNSLTFTGTPSDTDTGIYDIIVFASSTNAGTTSTVQSSLNIAVANINQAPTSVFVDYNAINENSENEVVGTVSVSDPDTTDTHALTVDDNRFQILNGQLQLKPGIALDFETEATAPTIPLQITATDPFGESASTNIDVSLNDTNDLPVGPATLPLQTANDAQPFHYRIPDGTFTDQDGNEITLSAELIDGTDLPQWLTFDSNTNTFSGQASEADQGIVQIQLNAFDGSGYALAKTAIIVNVSNVNQAPTGISLDNSSVAENETGAVVGYLQSEDPDTGDTHQYAADDDRFQIENGQLSLKPFVSLNHEIEPSVNVAISSTDNQGESFTELFSITILDQNDAPKINATLSDMEATQDELFSYTIPIDTFIDEDVENANGDTLSLVVSLDDDSTLPDWLVFDEQNRVLSGTPENDDVGQYAIKVVALDSSGMPSEPLLFAITVNNVNDVPEILSLSNSSVTEETFGAVVGELSVLDIDTNATFSLSVDDHRFNIIGTQLLLKPDQKIDFETEPTVSLTIGIEDEFNATSTRTFVIEIIEVNEEPEPQSTIKELNASIDQPLDISSVSFIDPDNETVTLSVIGADGNALPAWIKYNALEQTIEFDNPPADLSTIDIMIVAEDERGSRVEQEVTIKVSYDPELGASQEELPETTTQETTTSVNQSATQASNNATQKPETQANNGENKEPAQNEALLEIKHEIDSIDLEHLIKPLEIVHVNDTEHENTVFSSKNEKISLNKLDLTKVGDFNFNLRNAFENVPAIKYNELASEFDRQKDHREEALASESKIIASSFTFTSGLSVGYLLWLIRGGTLMGSVLSSLPAWRLVDPLPILGSLVDEDQDDDDESLESMVEKKPPEDPEQYNRTRDAA